MNQLNNLSQDDIKKVNSIIIIISRSDSEFEASSDLINQEYSLLAPLETITEHEHHSLNALYQHITLTKQSTKNMHAPIPNDHQQNKTHKLLQQISQMDKLSQNLSKYSQIKQKYKQLLHASSIDRPTSSNNITKKSHFLETQIKFLKYLKWGQRCVKQSVGIDFGFGLRKIGGFASIITIRRGNYCQSFVVVRLIEQKDGYTLSLVKSLMNCMMYSLKMVSKQGLSGQERKSLMKEVAIQSEVNHSNFIKLYHVISDQYRIYLLYEPIIEKSLHEAKKCKKRQWEQGEVINIIKQIASALKYLEKMSLVHLSITPENIYIQEGMVKIMNFSTAKRREQLTIKKQHLAHQMEQFVDVDDKADIWNLGILVYELLFKREPIIIKKQHKNKMKIKQEMELYFDEEEDVSQKGKQFIRGCLQRDYSKRLGINDILQHIFLSKTQKYRWTTY